MRAMLGWVGFSKGSTAVPYDLFGMNVFRSWIAETIVKQKGLTFSDAANQFRLMLILSFYYHSMFNYDKNGGSYNPSELATIARMVVTNMGNPRLYDEALELFSSLPALHGVEELCEAISAHCGERLRNFNVAMLYTYVGGAWFGDRELVAVALESIPTFYTMLYFSVDSRNYAATAIGKVVKERARRNEGSEFVAALNKLPIFLTSKE